jgi:glyoxylase-like metal-dependent hydrolase (beta-lactamase superfamily II)
MQRLTDGVYAFTQEIEAESGSRAFHPSAVETDRGLLLLDVGLPGAADALEEELAAVGFEWTDVWTTLVTHQDGDHAGALSTVRDRSDCVVFAHPECAPYVDGRKDPIKSDGERYPPVPVDVEIPGGTRFRTVAGPIDVVFTPGHAPGHVSLFFPDERLLVAADALTATDGELQGPSERFTLDMAGARESAARLADLPVERVLCYHGGVADADGDRIADVADSLEV